MILFQKWENKIKIKPIHVNQFKLVIKNPNANTKKWSDKIKIYLSIAMDDFWRVNSGCVFVVLNINNNAVFSSSSGRMNFGCSGWKWNALNYWNWAVMCLLRWYFNTWSNFSVLCNSWFLRTNSWSIEGGGGGTTNAVSTYIRNVKKNCSFTHKFYLLLFLFLFIRP